MDIFTMKTTDLRLLLPEVISLEPEHIEQAREISLLRKSEPERWQSYLNGLALVSFEQWVSERISDKKMVRDTHLIESVGYIRVGEFKVCLIATEHILDEVVNLPQEAINNPEEAAHFYVVLEVLEEQEEIIVRGFLRYDQLVNDIGVTNLQLLENGCYQLPLSLFDAEPNHLLFYCRCLEPTAIPLPLASAEHSTRQILTKASEKLPESLKETRSKLSQWLQGVFNSSWQAVDTLINPEVSLALHLRKAESSMKRGKLIDLGMQLGNQTFALLMTVTENPDEKLGILAQLHPTGGEKYLPPNLKLTLLSKAGKTLQEVSSRSQDNYIQLKPFKGELGKRFTIEVKLDEMIFREYFEL